MAALASSKNTEKVTRLLTLHQYSTVLSVQCVHPGVAVIGTVLDPESPAQMKNLPGLQIVAVDGKDVRSCSLDQVQRLVRRRPVTLQLYGKVLRGRAQSWNVLLSRHQRVGLGLMEPEVASAEKAGNEGTLTNKERKKRAKQLRRRREHCEHAAMQVVRLDLRGPFGRTQLKNGDYVTGIWGALCPASVRRAMEQLCKSWWTTMMVALDVSVSRSPTFAILPVSKQGDKTYASQSTADETDPDPSSSSRRAAVDILTLEVSAKKEKVASAKGIGLVLRKIRTTQFGGGDAVLIDQVLETSPFADKGLIPGQRLLSINGEQCPTSTSQAFNTLIKATGKVTLEVSMESVYEQAASADGCDSYESHSGSAANLSQRSILGLTPPSSPSPFKRSAQEAKEEISEQDRKAADAEMKLRRPSQWIDPNVAKLATLDL